MTNWILAGLDEHALHRLPPVVLVGRPHAVNLSLASNGVAILLARHAQIDISAHVFKAHGFVTLPEVAVTLNGPDVEVIAFAVLSESADLLWVARRAERVQRSCPTPPVHQSKGVCDLT